MRWIATKGRRYGMVRSCCLVIVALLLIGAADPLAEARRLLREEQPAAALLILEELPLTFEALFLRGVAHLQLSQLDQAATAFQAVLGGPREDDAHYFLHEIAHRRGGVCPYCGFAPAGTEVVPAGDRTGIMLRVVLEREVPSVTLKGERPLVLVDVDNGVALTPGSRYEIPVQAGTRGFIIGEDSTEIRRLRVTSTAPIKAGRGLYRGEVLLLWSDWNKLAVINKLNIEEYLYGVLKKEISPAWPPAALEAQAIAARTFALYQAEQNQGQDFDLGDDLFSQMYGGVYHEDPRCQAAVDATRGLVMRYEGKLIPAYYHSASGGQTAGAEEVWSRAEPFLFSTTDPYSEGSPYHKWELTLTGWQLGERLQRYNVGKVEQLEVLQRSTSGRARQMRVVGSRNTVTLSGNALRLAVGPNEFKSTLLTAIEHLGDTFRIQGAGWGHGVGLSQWSAKTMAEHGWDAEQILHFFYRDIEIGK